MSHLTESEIVDLAMRPARLSREQLLTIAESAPYCWPRSAVETVERLVADLLAERHPASRHGSR